MIILDEFEPTSDNKRLIEWVDSSRLNIIWASDKFKFPLDEQVLNSYFEKATQNGIIVFKVVNQEKENTQVVGHAELDVLGNEIKISRLLISKQHRGKGYGEQMVSALIEYIQDNLQFEDICLTVFTFNKPAIGLYKKLGFEVVKIDKGFMKYKEEVWDRQKMKLRKL